jgi:hypothetical protein
MHLVFEGVLVELSSTGNDQCSQSIAAFVHACRSETLVRRLVRLESNTSHGKIFIVKECAAGREVRGNTQDLESEGQSRGRVKGKWITP